MDETKAKTLKINLRVTAKIAGGIIFAALAFFVAFRIGLPAKTEPSAYADTSAASETNKTGTLLPPPPFAGNPPLSSMKR